MGGMEVYMKRTESDKKIMYGWHRKAQARGLMVLGTSMK